MLQKNGKTKSLKMLTLTLWLIVTAVFSALFSIFAGFFVQSAREEQLKSGRTFADHYATNLDRDIRQMTDTVDELYVNSIFYRRLIYYSLDDYDWVDNTWHVQSSLREKSAAMDFQGGYFYYDSPRNSLRSLFGQDLSDSLLNDTLKEWIRINAKDNPSAGYLTYGNDVWYVSYKGIRGRILGYMINLSDYVVESDEEEILYLDSENTVVYSSGRVRVPQELLLEAQSSGQYTRKGLTATVSPIPSAGLKLVLVMTTNPFQELLRRPDFLILITLVPVLTLFLLLYLYRFHRRAVLIPVNHMLDKVNELRMAQGADGIPEKPENGSRSLADTLLAQEAENIREYRTINDRIDEMLQEISDLAEARHREELNTKNALLQYYQLQIDPHFYLNCLNSVSSLLQNNTPEIANDMIMALSSHFRYVFQSSRTCVALSDELKELRNYCSIYTIKGGVPILFSTEVPDEVMDRRIPILAIQTFVENSIKHVTKKGKILSVRVHAHRIARTDELLIRITDNGPGYPEEMLALLNTPVTEFNFDSEHVGILNLKYRCRLLYDGRERFSFYNAPQGGAATEILLPPENMEN